MKPSTPISGGAPRTPLRDRSNLLISPFPMSPKAIISQKSPVPKTFSLETEEDDGYLSVESDGVEELLNGNWKPNFDGDLDDDDVEETPKTESEILMPTFLEPVVVVSSSDANSNGTGCLKYTEADVAAMKAQWMAEVRAEMLREKETLVARLNASEAAQASMQEKEGEYMALISEYEATVTALEQDRKANESSNLEAYGRQLSELELANTRLRTERQELEASFQQLHKRYEQLKTLQANAIKNEGVLKQTLAKSQADLMTAEARFLRLKTHAQAQLDAANTEITRIREESVKRHVLLAAKLSLTQTQLASVSVEWDLSRVENQKLNSVVADLCEQIQPRSSTKLPAVASI